MSEAIEAVRAFWDRRPCNLKHSPAKVGTREYFDQVTERKYFVEPHILTFADFSMWKGKRVLEVGCGIGTDAVEFASAGADYTGIELSGESLKLARKRFKVYGLKGKFHQMNAEEKLPKGPFDLVYCWGVLHHTPNPLAMLSNIAKVMEKGAHLRLMVYAAHSWKKAMIDAGLDQFEAQAGVPPTRTYGKISLAMNLLSAFRDIDIEQDHIFPYVWQDYVKYKYTLQPWFEVMPREMFRALEKSFGWHLLVKAVRA